LNSRKKNVLPIKTLALYQHPPMMTPTGQKSAPRRIKEVLNSLPYMYCLPTTSQATRSQLRLNFTLTSNMEISDEALLVGLSLARQTPLPNNMALTPTAPQTDQDTMKNALLDNQAATNTSPPNTQEATSQTIQN
jgi:hypothetical protein